jgi:hypothetical protein
MKNLGAFSFLQVRKRCRKDRKEAAGCFGSF